VKNLLSLLILFSLLQFSSNAIAQNKATITENLGFEVELKSSVLNEQRRLLVNLPDGYIDSEKRYPVLYLLDGSRHFSHAVTASKILLEDGRIPELIIVGITNNPGTRGRDLARERDRFVEFIETELTTYIDKTYRTSELKTLFGHSMAGYFSMRLLAEENPIFSNYIAASPVLQNGREVVNELLSKDIKLQNNNLYFSLAGKAEEGQRTTGALDKVVNTLETNKALSVNWQYQLHKSLTHMTTPYPTLFEGLNFVFQSYQAPRFSSSDEFDSFGGLKALSAHYKKRASLYNTSAEVPELPLRDIADLLSEEGKNEKALAIYKKVVKRFPESAAAHSGLGEVYKSLNKLDKSIESHTKAVTLSKSLNQGWQRFLKRRLDNVKKLKDSKS